MLHGSTSRLAPHDLTSLDLSCSSSELTSTPSELTPTSIPPFQDDAIATTNTNITTITTLSQTPPYSLPFSSLPLVQRCLPH